MHLVASVCLFVGLIVCAHLFEPFEPRGYNRLVFRAAVKTVKTAALILLHMVLMKPVFPLKFVHLLVMCLF